MHIFNNRTKKFALILIGPIGCYIAYQILFIFRYLNIEQYPILTSVYTNGGAIIDSACALAVIFMGGLIVRRVGILDDFSPSQKSLSTISLMLIIAGIFGLLAMSVYRTLGTLSPEYFMQEYQTYNFKATDGGAWMILAIYAALFLQLMDMYFGGVTKKNGAFLVLSILVTSLSGGRGILILFSLMFIVLMMFQRVKFVDFLIASSLAVASIGVSYVLITDMRAPQTHRAVLPHGVRIAENRLAVNPTDSFEDMNYNAAFISEDVLSAIKSHEIEPSAYALEDAQVTFVPRKLMPSKAISTAETRAIYPEVAKRGTNITFPLKANLLMHLGEWAFYADWIVVAICQALMIFGIVRRNSTPGLLGFAMLFSGIGFTLVARGGIFNARLLVILACILAAYAGYRALLSAQNGLSFSRKLPGITVK